MFGSYLTGSRNAAAVVASFMLPLSTSVEAIAVSGLALLSILTLEFRYVAERIRSASALLPLFIFALILIGTTWSPVPLGQALKGVGAYAKLMLIPLLFLT